MNDRDSNRPKQKPRINLLIRGSQIPFGLVVVAESINFSGHRYMPGEEAGLFI
jgi:hypothetical protein